MFTVCPKCTLTLVVTTVDLRAGQGYVRCGRCANVFNALVALREGDPSGSISDSTRQRQLESPATPPPEPAFGAGVAMDPEPEAEPQPEPQPEPEPEPDSAPDTEPEEPSLEFDATATDVSEIFISPTESEHDTASGNYEAVVLGEDPVSAAEVEAEHELPADDPSHTDTIAADDWSLLDDDEPPADAESVIEESPLAEAAEPEPEPEPAEEVAEVTEETQEQAQDPAWVDEMFAEAEVEAERARTAERLALQADAEDDSGEPAVVRAARDVRGVSAASGDTIIEPLLQPVTRGRPAWQYATGIGVLAVTLLLQLLHHHRRELVLNTTVGGAVSTVYGWFGATPAPRWDLTAYTVTQLGAEAEGAEGTRLRVRLSVQNDSDRVQPLPLLRLTLQDRYGNAVATRDLEPTEYLPPRASDQRLLEPDQRIDAELHVMDPGKAAIGFEIDACLRAESGNIGCANDARRRAAG